MWCAAWRLYQQLTTLSAYLRVAKRVDLTRSHWKRTNSVTMRGDGSTRLTMIISQCIQAPNHCVEHPKLIWYNIVCQLYLKKKIKLGLPLQRAIQGITHAYGGWFLTSPETSGNVLPKKQCLNWGLWVRRDPPAGRCSRQVPEAGRFSPWEPRGRPDSPGLHQPALSSLPTKGN